LKLSQTRLISPELEALGLDLEASLREDSRVLLDPQLLAALHQELESQLEAAEARAALLQLGFLHGLRDALLLTGAALNSGPEMLTQGPMAPRLAMRMSQMSSDGLHVSGSWPERLETLHREPSEAPAGASCFLSSGYTSGWLSGLFELDVLALEVGCTASGAPQCDFQARPAVHWRESGDAAAAALLRALPFEALRQVVERHLAERPDPEPSPGDRFEPGAPVVHVWGPVMVLPFAGPEESLRALELIGQDLGAQEVRVVVVDLSGTVIDEGFGAAALEQVLEAVEGWGAEPVLTGISPFSERVVAELEKSHLIMRKDLPEVVASAFQLAEALRRGQ
jgi:anti-anti-sigma regulatory factor